MLVVAAGSSVSWESAAAQDNNRQRSPAPRGEDIGSSSTDPLQQIGSLMVDVQLRLHGRDTSQETQALQRSIVERLSNMIEQQSQSASQQSATGSQAQETRPDTGQRPGSTGGPGATQSSSGGPGNTDVLFQQIWGHLPDQVRRHVETPLHEKFLPQYDDLIQDYFKRLANETPK